MSSGYNDRLTPLAWKGECGDRETEEVRSKWLPKAKELAGWMAASKHTVVFTGAGISCAAGIPDFRGPKGVWTLEKKGAKPECDVAFEDAKPTFTHYALVALMKRGLLQHVVSQNVDNLHLKSGIPRANLSELHGNIFAEHCDQCNTEYIRNFDVHGMGCKPTGRFCEKAGCGGPLRDKTIDWHTALPEEEFGPAIEHHQRAELALCLGTSLRIRPAGNMPLRTLRKHKKDAPGRLVIVNLQKTDHDRSASMRFHVRTDPLFRELCRLLEVHVPEDDAKVAAAAQEAASAEDAATAAVAAAAAASPPPPRKVKQPSNRQAIGRPTRDNTQRLRQLYNKPKTEPQADDLTQQVKMEESTVKQEEEEDDNAAAAAGVVPAAAAAAYSAAAAAASFPAAAAASSATASVPHAAASSRTAAATSFAVPGIASASASAAAAASARPVAAPSPSGNVTVKRPRDPAAAAADDMEAPSSKWPRGPTHAAAASAQPFGLVQQPMQQQQQQVPLPATTLVHLQQQQQMMQLMQWQIMQQQMQQQMQMQQQQFPQAMGAANAGGPAAFGPAR